MSTRKQIKPGDVITVTGSGRSVEIRVDTAHDMNADLEAPDWYVQGKRTDNGRCVYVKQHVDGVTITKLNA